MIEVRSFGPFSCHHLTGTPVQHVGAKYYDTYFKLIDFALKSRDAAVVVTSSTFPESRYTNYQ
jgi:hypothetical protein